LTKVKVCPEQFHGIIGHGSQVDQELGLAEILNISLGLGRDKEIRFRI
jgi:hypothetical protein